MYGVFALFEEDLVSTNDIEGFFQKMEELSRNLCDQEVCLNILASAKLKFEFISGFEASNSLVLDV